MKSKLSLQMVAKAVSVDFDVLIEKGKIQKEMSFDDLDEALAAYKEVYEGLSTAREVIFGNEGEGFDFRVHITSHAPYVITIKIYLV